MFTDIEKSLYDRHLILPGFGEEVQGKLKNTRVLIAGAGGLGSPVAIYLAAAGIGIIGIADADEVSLSNLQRQVLYSYPDVGKLKADIALQRLSSQNPFIQINSYPFYLTESNVEELVSNYDIIVGALDNSASRYLLNDACVKLGKIYVHGAISNFTGQVTVFNYKSGKTYRDLFPEPPLVSDVLTTDKGVFAPLPGVIGTLLATEILKVATGCGDVLSGKLLLVDLQKNIFQIIDY